MSVWYAIQYYYFASAIILISSIMIVHTLYMTRSNLTNIQKRAHYKCNVNVLRFGKSVLQISSVDLVPGDIIEIPSNCLAPCDLILLTGTCVMNESMLTGESVPAIKSPIPLT